MLRIKSNRIVLQAFNRTKRENAPFQQRTYKASFQMPETSFQKMLGALQDLTNDALENKRDKLDAMFIKMSEDHKPNRNGNVSIGCWPEDSNLSGITTSDGIYPYQTQLDGDLTVIDNCELEITAILSQKKDDTIAMKFAVQAIHENIDSVEDRTTHTHNKAEHAKTVKSKS